MLIILIRQLHVFELVEAESYFGSLIINMSSFYNSFLAVII